jgi:hypothetical protein
MTAILFTTVVSIFIYKAILTRSNASQGELLLPSILNSIQITVFGAVYHKVRVLLVVLFAVACLFACLHVCGVVKA